MAIRLLLWHVLQSYLDQRRQIKEQRRMIS